MGTSQSMEQASAVTVDNNAPRSHQNSQTDLQNHNHDVPNSIQRHSLSSIFFVQSKSQHTTSGGGQNGTNDLIPVQQQYPPIKEHKRHGVVSVKINTISSNRRNSDANVPHFITPRGAIMFGSLFNPSVIQNAITASHFPILSPAELPIDDSRAHKLFVTYCQGWHVIPFPEVFSRHSGTCYIVGDRTFPGVPFQLKVGDCFRLGSVGLVVSEMRVGDSDDEQRLDAKTLQFLKDEALAFDTNEDLAMLASDEMENEVMKKNTDTTGRMREFDADGDGDLTHVERDTIADNDSSVADNDNSSVEKDAASNFANNGTIKNHNNNSDCESAKSKKEESTVMMSPGLTNGEKYICYMCYETHNTPEDPLIAPCDCKGDTRFLHVQCLQRWYHSSSSGSHAQVIRTTGNGAPACKICGSAYKTNFRRKDGKKSSVLEVDNDGPYLSLVVVTHHDTNPGLFNTKFRLNFGRRSSTPSTATDSDLNTISIGRSSTCTMTLDYRTVSTNHAKISFINGKFFLSDNRSSNGTMVYIRDPLALPYSKAMKIRMGRTTITLQARRSWTAAMRSYLFQSKQHSGTTSNKQLETSGSFFSGCTGASSTTAAVDVTAREGADLQQGSLRTPNNSGDYSALAGAACGDMLSPTDMQQFLATLHMVPNNSNNGHLNGHNMHVFTEPNTDTHQYLSGSLSHNDLIEREYLENNGVMGEFALRSRQQQFLSPSHMDLINGDVLHSHYSPHSPDGHLHEQDQEERDRQLAMFLSEQESALLLQQEQYDVNQNDRTFGQISSRINSPSQARVENFDDKDDELVLPTVNNSNRLVVPEGYYDDERRSTPVLMNAPQVAGTSASIVVNGNNNDDRHLLHNPSPQVSVKNFSSGNVSTSSFGNVGDVGGSSTGSNGAGMNQLVDEDQSLLFSRPTAQVFAIPAHEKRLSSPATPSMLSCNNLSVSNMSNMSVTGESANLIPQVDATTTLNEDQARSL